MWRCKKYGRKIELREDWDYIKFDFMNDFVKQKFKDPKLAERLKNTKDLELIEGNTWGDRYWGKDQKGVGQNNLGKILMNIRDSL